MLGGPSGAGNRIGVGCIHGINRCTTVSPAPPLGTRVSRHFHGLLPLPGMPFPIYQQGCFLYLLQMLRYHPSEPSSHKQQTFIPFCSLPISVSLSSYLHSFFLGGGSFQAVARALLTFLGHPRSTVHGLNLAPLGTILRVSHIQEICSRP